MAAAGAVPCWVACRAAGTAAWRCSQCMRIRLLGQPDWAETDLPPAALLGQDICPGCARRLFGDQAVGPEASG